jgi:hypothetical protein
MIPSLFFPAAHQAAAVWPQETSLIAGGEFFSQRELFYLAVQNAESVEVSWVLVGPPVRRLSQFQSPSNHQGPVE